MEFKYKTYKVYLISDGFTKSLLVNQPQYVAGNIADLAEQIFWRSKRDTGVAMLVVLEQIVENILYS